MPECAQLAVLANFTGPSACLRVDRAIERALHCAHASVVFQLVQRAGAEVRCDFLDLHTVIWVELQLKSICTLLLTGLEILFVLGHDFRFAFKSAKLFERHDLPGEMCCSIVVSILVKQLECASHKQELVSIFKLAQSYKTGKFANLPNVCICRCNFSTLDFDSHSSDVLNKSLNQLLKFLDFSLVCEGCHTDRPQRFLEEAKSFSKLTFRSCIEALTHQVLNRLQTNWDQRKTSSTFDLEILNWAVWQSLCFDFVQCHCIDKELL